MRNNDLKRLNEVWRSGALMDFIRRMLVYYDPMAVIALGAPHDEYDAYIPKIQNLILREGMTVDELGDSILDLWAPGGDDAKNMERKARRMAEDLIDLKNS
jgi:hypothetical protein